MPDFNLKLFRDQVYHCLGNAKDAVFELTDAAILTRSPESLAELSLSPVFRRKWHSTYEALEDCNPSREKMMTIYSQQIASNQRPLLVGDHSAWFRPDAVTLQERTYEHKPHRISVNRPIGIGFGYSTIAYIPEQQGSWALPLLHERINSHETAISKLSTQIRRVGSQLETKPILVVDSQYGCASFVQQTADIPCDKLMRLSSNRCLWGEPTAYSGRGRPRKHGDKFKLNDRQTWFQEDDIEFIEHPRLGLLQIQAWHQLHFRQAANQKLSLVRVEQLDSRHSKPLWLAWNGEEMPTLIEVVGFYLRRFTIEHWYRFAKQRLHWTLPNLGTKEQCDRWSDLMPMMTWELWLAREIIVDRPLPWQKPQINLTPGRVAQGFGTVIATLGTPASAPKPRGKSPGWQHGKVRKKKIRYPLVKKGKGRFESQKKAKLQKLSA
ncbi:MAG: NF041680 family putative transposase [Cyanobacteria bacterium P01_A01_bin.83]